MKSNHDCICDCIRSIKEDFQSAMDGMKMHLVQRSEPNKLFYLGELIAASSFSPKMVNICVFYIEAGRLIDWYVF